MENEQVLERQIKETSIQPSERLGQHFLIDQETVDFLSQLVTPGAKVIEIGSGMGNITPALAKKADEVVGIEIDKRFQPMLQDLQEASSNISFIIADALQVDLTSLVCEDQETQIVANLPFHITEPFLHRLIDLPIANAVLMLGAKAAEEVQAPEDHPSFGKLSLLAQTFFNVETLKTVPKEAFYPPPRTKAAIIELSPKQKREINSSPINFLFAHLIRRAGKHGLVINDLKQVLVEASQRSKGTTLDKKAFRRRSRAQARREIKQQLTDYNATRDISTFKPNGKRARTPIIISPSQAIREIERLGLPESLLNKPFFRLNNQEIAKLSQAIRQFYS